MMILMEPFDNLAGLLNHHICLHKGFELRDAYKLVYQSVCGPEHLGEGIAERSIANEAAAAGCDPEEPLLEPISQNTHACRLNLRAMNRLDIQSALVARAVRESAGRFSGDRGEVSRLWHEVGASLEHLAAAFSPEALSDLTQFLEDNEYPPMHHSTSYREYNRPAYRVLLRGELEMLMPDLPASDLWR